MNTITKNNILIVEDEVFNIELYKEMLKGQFQLQIAENGEQAIRIMETGAAEQKPDALLLDIMLPDINGMDLCRRFKENKDLVHIPIIMATSLDSPEDKILALEAGANDFLTKPVDRHELKLKLKNHLTILEQFKQIKNQNAEINRFVEAIVHDLKNPLTAIVGYIDLLSGIVPDEATRRYVDQVGMAAQRMRHSIGEILDIQQIRRSSFTINTNAFDVNLRIEEIVPDWQVQAQRKHISIKLSLGKILPKARGDREKFKDIFDNLVSNALKYSPMGTTIKIATGTAPDDSIKVMVKDQGQGLMEKDKELVFGEFQRLSAKPTGKETSTGLGLSIVRRLVELMGGTVGVESEGKNKGSAFWFTLPHHRDNA